MEAKKNDDQPRRRGQERFVLRQHLADFGGDGAESDEDDAEAEDEGRRVAHHLAKQMTLGDLSSSTPAPEISETYPGTSGSTQGERNEIRPAKKAASGNGRLVIGSILGFYSSGDPL